MADTEPNGEGERKACSSHGAEARPSCNGECTGLSDGKARTDRCGRTSDLKAKEPACKSSRSCTAAKLGFRDGESNLGGEGGGGRSWQQAQRTTNKQARKTPKGNRARTRLFSEDAVGRSSVALEAIDARMLIMRSPLPIHHRTEAQAHTPEAVGIGKISVACVRTVPTDRKMCYG